MKLLIIKSVLVFFTLGLVAIANVNLVFADEDLLQKPTIGEDGLYQQKWFHNSFLDLKEDLLEAKAVGKRFVVFWEQKGCPYCKRTHEVNLRIPRIVKYISDHFLVVHLNIWGDKEVTDFDGDITTEKKLAEKWGVRFTPTIQFFPDNPKNVSKKKGSEVEVMRIPGYFKPFHFYFLFKYVKASAYKTQPNFQRWLSGEGDKLAEKGLNIQKQLWSDKLLFDE
ncbi:MAG: thioredoxin family protein [Pseudomonadota bacterium]|nr:thioredoxin family protein [Pseudomonadota bacterium]